MTKSKPTNKISIGGDVAGNLIQGDGNTLIHNEIDGEEISRSLERVSDVIYETSSRGRLENFWETSQRQESRKVLETIFISFVSGIVMGVFWKFAYPWNVQTVPFFIILTLLFSLIVGWTHFGVRHSFTLILILGLAYSILIEYSVVLNDWMNLNQFAGTAMLATSGAFIGLLASVISFVLEIFGWLRFDP
jgi:F0F1-type ATP synthase assembly protein I